MIKWLLAAVSKEIVTARCTELDVDRELDCKLTVMILQHSVSVCTTFLLATASDIVMPCSV